MAATRGRPTGGACYDSIRRRPKLADLRWGRIWRAVEAAVHEANPRQRPWLSAGLDGRICGSGPDEDADPGFAIVQVPSGTLYVTLLDCVSSGRVLRLGVKGALPKRSRHVFWLSETLGSPFVASLPDGLTVGVVRIAAIATTRPGMSLDYLLHRESLDDSIYPERRTRAADAGFTGAAAPEEAWTSAVTAVRIVRA